MKKTTLGQTIRELREAKGWTIHALSKRVGISNQAMYDLELHGAAPSFSTVRRLAAVLEFSIDWLSEQLLSEDLPAPPPLGKRGRPRKSPAK